MEIAELKLLRDWVRAEVAAAIARSQEGSDGYLGSSSVEEDEAERMFDQLRFQLELQE